MACYFFDRRQQMVIRKEWEEFRKSGLLWFINMMLHVFGWAIVYEYENEKITSVYPARTKYRGFDEKSNTDGYKKVTQYMFENCQKLKEEAEE